VRISVCACELWNLFAALFNSGMRISMLFKFTRLHVLRYLYNKHQVILNIGAAYIKSYFTCVNRIRAHLETPYGSATLCHLTYILF